MEEIRLIDANALKRAIGNAYGLSFEEMKEMFPWLENIDNAPTIGPKIVPVCKVIFDKEQLQEMVDKKIADLLESGALSKVEQKQSVDDKCKTCKYYFYAFEGHPCINCRRNFKLIDEIREQKNDLWKDGTPNG